MKIKRSILRIFMSIIMGVSLLFMTSTGIFAVDTTLTNPTNFSGSKTLSQTNVELEGSGVSTWFDIDTTVSWNQVANINATYDPNLVRQGRNLDPTVSVNRPVNGIIKITWTLKNLRAGWDGATWYVELGDQTFSAFANCDMYAEGSGYSVHLESGQITLLDSYPLLNSPYVKLGMAADVTITPDGITTVRQAFFSGTPDGTANLTLGESAITDYLKVLCTTGVGDELSYTLDTLSSEPAIDVTSSMIFEVGAILPAPVIGTPYHQEFASPTITLPTLSDSIIMTGSGSTFNMGEVLPNNIPPVANAGGPYSGDEGSPIKLDGSASTSICGMPALRWDFSDGGVAFGTSPQHIFQGPGIYSGLLTATDVTGLSSVTTFSVEVKDLPPMANAGPNMSTKWGIPVTLKGSALNPGTDQQPYLVYRWVFGDGTPSASGGATVTHVYDQPGDYIATFTATDPGGLFDNDKTHVVVEKRATILGYFGPLTSSSSQTVPLKAVLKDEFGNPLEGRTVVFTLGSNPEIQPPVTALTDSNGVAVFNLKLKLKAGSYPLNVDFTPIPGSTDITKYMNSSASAIFKIGKK